MRRSVLGVLAAALLAVGGRPAHAGDDLGAMTNADRTARGLAALTPAGDLQAFAQRRAEEMARAGRLWHSEDLDARITGWRRLGENVGRGSAVAEIHRSFMASGRHRNNILLAHFSQIGVGVASDGRYLLYVAVVFRQPASGPVPPSAAAARPARPRPGPRAAARPRPARRALPPAPGPAATPTPEPPSEPAQAPVVASPPPPQPAPAGAAPLVERPSRRVIEEPWFLAANIGNSPAPAPQPAPGGLFPPVLAAVTVGLLGVCGVAHRRRRDDALSPPQVGR